MNATDPILTVVIPALNEERAIHDTIEDCLKARSRILQQSRVRDVEIIVVSDGSTDRTEEIARGFSEVTVLAFDRNRGYGAAIKAGFERAAGDWVGFLDADGTCAAESFADLCRALEQQHVDLAIGSRMGAQSEMPWVRSLGNLLFAWMLGVLSKRSISDTASGMRVIRRDVLPDLYPLPDGLHFTPAMTACALLEGKLRMVEVPIPYAERIGRSKLSVLRDGLRFLRSIVQAAMCYQPARPLLVIAAVAGVAALAIVFEPVRFYARFARLEEWMIYRSLLASLLATVTWILVAAAVVADHIAGIAHHRETHTSGVTGLAARLFTPRMRWLAGAGLVVAAVATVWPGIVEYATSGEVYMHWSRAVVASLLLVIAVTLGVSVFLINMMELIRERRETPVGAQPPDRIHNRRAPQGP